MSVKFKNHATPVGKRAEREFYKWRLFVDEPRDVLEQIKAVEYVLHPTFPEPVQTRTDPENQFALEAAAWGSFMAAIRVYYKDGRKEDTSYWVDLKKKSPDDANRN